MLFGRFLVEGRGFVVNTTKSMPGLSENPGNLRGFCREIRFRAPRGVEDSYDPVFPIVQKAGKPPRMTGFLQAGEAPGESRILFFLWTAWWMRDPVWPGGRRRRGDRVSTCSGTKFVREIAWKLYYPPSRADLRPACAGRTASRPRPESGNRPCRRFVMSCALSATGS